MRNIKNDKEKYPDAITVFVGPCIAKKDEIKDKSIEGNADYVLTIGEFRAMMRAKEIVLNLRKIQHSSQVFMASVLVTAEVLRQLF